jgi:hypothetical protein
MTDSEAHHLLGSQRNQIFTTLQNRGFAPADFDLQDIVIGEQEAVRLVQKATNYHFQITIRRFSTPPFVATYSPGSEFSSEIQSCATWSDVVMNLEFWVSYILRETEAPDLWDGLEGGNQLLQDATDEQPSDNLPFTQAELPKVRECLENIKEYVLKTHELSEAQIKIVDARFEYMEEAATRLGRKDWINIVISGLLGLATTLTFSGDSTRDLFQFAGQVVRQLLGTMLYLASPH